MNRFPQLLTLAIFALTAFALIAHFFGDLRPHPIYGTIRLDPEHPPPPAGFLKHEWVEIEFKAPADRLTGFYFPGLLPQEHSEVEIKVENLSEQLLAHESVLRDHASEVRFEKFARKGDDIRLSLRWKPETRPTIVSENGQPIFLTSTESKIEAPPPAGGDPVELSADDPLVFHFVAEEADLQSIIFPGMRRGVSKVRLRIFNETRGVELRSTKWTRDDKPFKRWNPNNAAGDRIRVELSWEPSANPPSLKQADVEPAEQLLVKVGGVESDFRPVFVAQYFWGTRGLQWLWPLAAIALGVAIWKPRRSTVITFFVVTGLLSTLTSMLFWQQRYSLVSAHTDPDRYGRYGQFLHDAVFEGRDLSENQEFQDYPHAYAAGVPAILAALCRIFPPEAGHAGFAPQIGYVGLVAVCGFGVLLLLGHIGREVFDLSDRQLLAGFAILASHLVFLKAFARPSTDLPGLLTVVAMIAVLLWRIRLAKPTQLVVGALVAFPLLFFRPSGPLHLLFFGIAFVVVDCVREGKLSPLKRIGAGFALVGPATAVFFILFFAFGWKHNLEIAFAKKTEFYDVTAWKNLLDCLPAVLGVLPVFWIFARFRGPLERKSAWIIIAWIAFYLVMIVATRAPFLTRLFLPLIPFFVLFALVGIREISVRWRWIGYALLGIASIANIAITIWLTTLPNLPPMPWARFIY